jgi:hypothetical protein
MFAVWASAQSCVGCAGLANIKEAIELVLEDMKAHGESIPDPSQVLVGSVVVT